MGIFGNWVIVVGVGVVVYGITGLVTEGFAGEKIIPTIGVFVVILFSIAATEVRFFIRASKIWKKAGGDDNIRKVILCGTPKFLDCWQSDSDELVVSKVLEPPRVVFWSVNGKWCESIEFDSLLTNLIYRCKLNEFIKLREALE